MPQPTEIKVRTRSRLLEISFDDGTHFELPFEYLRVFSISGGFGYSVQVSPEFGDTNLWPGDTFGISPLSPTHLVLSGGSATDSTGDVPEIFAAPVQAAIR